MPPLFYSQIELPAEFDRHLNNSVAEFVACNSERFASVGDQLALLIEVQVQGRIVGDEGRIRMVQEVVSREAELQFLVLGGSPGEILEQRQVSIKESWTGHSWEDVARPAGQVWQNPGSSSR